MRSLKLTLPVAAVLGFSSSAFATNGYQLIGVGAYQKSLGGAVTANPGTAMTAVTNPAGLTRVGKRADFSMEAFMPDRQSDFAATGGNEADSSAGLYGVPAIGWVAPASEDSEYYFGGGMFGTSGMGVDYGQTLMMGAPSFLPPGELYWDGYSNIAFWQMAPALARDVNDKLSVGLSLNIDYQSVAFKQRVAEDVDGDGATDFTVQNFDLSRGASAFGLGLTAGLLYDVNPGVTLGLSYKSKQNFSELEYQLSSGDVTNPKTGAPLQGGTYRLDLDFPQQLAAGVAVRATDKLTVSADIKWIEWSDTMNKLAVKGPNGSVVHMDPGWDDQTVYAVGLEYAVNERANIRAGFNYAESPIDAENVRRNLILPAIVETHYTVGGDYRVNKNWEVGAHYMMVPKSSLKASMTDPMAPGAEISLAEQSLGINIGYHF